VEILERKYPDWNGLNLSWEVLEGLRKHVSEHIDPQNPKQTHPSPSLEAQIADISDEIAYYSHDLDDGINFSLLQIEQLSELEIWREVEERVRQRYPDLSDRALCAYIIRCIIDFEVEDVVKTTSQALREADIANADDVRAHPINLVKYSEKTRRMNQQLRKFLYNNLYFHPRVQNINQRGCQLLQDYFRFLLSHPEAIQSFRTRYEQRDDSLHRQVCDYVSGMTDNFLIAEHYRTVGSE
jgi:dGTPase